MDLANTLRLISDDGDYSFYEGEIAEKIIEESDKRGGILTLEDLKNYEPVWREPLLAEIEDYTIVSMGPPSSGGIALTQLLMGAEEYVSSYEHNSVESIHMMSELMKRVYADRASFLGDPDFVEVPIDVLLDAEYLNERFKDIRII